MTIAVGSIGVLGSALVAPLHAINPSRRMPTGFHLLIAAQFASALADNALLIVTMAVLQERGMPAWWAPMLKFGFTLSYVVLAPFVGPLADAFPKARLMAWMNGVKVLGVLALLRGPASGRWPSPWSASALRPMRRPSTGWSPNSCPRDGWWRRTAGSR